MADGLLVATLYSLILQDVQEGAARRDGPRTVGLTDAVWLHGATEGTSMWKAGGVVGLMKNNAGISTGLSSARADWAGLASSRAAGAG